MNEIHKISSLNKGPSQAPLISVIVPVYNVKNYIDKCLTSIRAQTFENIEIICVNDCSPDDSWEIVKRHASEDDRFVLLEHEVNKGLGAARNTAIEAAKAEFLASADSDDYIDANMLETLWNASEEGEIDIVCCGFRNVSESGELLRDVVRPFAVYDFTAQKHNIFDLVNPSFWNKLWRKSLFVENNINFPGDLYYEDLSTTIMILSQCKSMKIIEDVLYSYLIRENSITNRYSEKHLIDIFTSHQMIAEFLISNDLMVKYKAEFGAYLCGSLNYELKNLMASNLNEQKKIQLVKVFSMMKAGFIEMYEEVIMDDFIILADEMRLVR